MSLLPDNPPEPGSLHEHALNYRTAQTYGEAAAAWVRLEAFVSRAIEAERARCATICRSRYMGDNTREDMEARACAEAIRTRCEMNWKPITTQEAVDALDDDLLVAGYRAGLRDTPDYTQTEQAYWHGFNNGQCDSGRAQISDEQRLLARNTFAATFQQIFGTKH